MKESKGNEGISIYSSFLAALWLLFLVLTPWWLALVAGLYLFYNLKSNPIRLALLISMLVVFPQIMGEFKPLKKKVYLEIPSSKLNSWKNLVPLNELPKDITKGLKCRGFKFYKRGEFNKDETLKVVLSPLQKNNIPANFNFFALSELRQLCGKIYVYSDFKGRSRAEEKNLAKDLLFGQKANLDKETLESFKKTGLYHLLAVSGLHFGVLCVGFYWILIRILQIIWSFKRFELAKKVSATLGLILAFSYYFYLPSSPSILRALIFCVLYFLGILLSRNSVARNSLWVALSLILLINPFDIYRPGLWYSFLAVWALTEDYSDRASFKRLMLPQLNLYILTGALTLILSGFFPVFGLFYNLIFVPVYSFLVFPSQLLSGIFDLGFFMEPLNQFFNIVNHLPAPVYRFQILSLWLVLPLFLICFSFKLRDLKQKKGLLLFSLSFLVALLMAKPSNLKPKARAYILDVGHGDAIFLQNSKGKWLLWDTGINRYSRSISRFLFTQKTEKSLGILISHSDLDHYGGAHEISKALKIPVYLEKLAYFKVANKSFKIINSEFREKLKNEFGLHIYPRPQMAWLSDNNLSMVANFKLKTKNILLPGDLEWKGEEIVRPNPAEVLILGHHGSKTSTGKEWLEKVNPKLAIHSGKAKDLHPIVKKRVLSKKIKIYSTANLGSIELSESKTGEIIIKMP